MRLEKQSSTSLRRVRVSLCAYGSVGVLSLIFQVVIRLQQCSGTSSCTISIAKGIVWSTIWPAYWPVYLAGL